MYPGAAWTPTWWQQPLPLLPQDSRPRHEEKNTSIEMHGCKAGTGVTATFSGNLCPTACSQCQKTRVPGSFLWALPLTTYPPALLLPVELLPHYSALSSATWEIPNPEHSGHSIWCPQLEPLLGTELLLGTGTTAFYLSTLYLMDGLRKSEHLAGSEEASACVWVCLGSGDNMVSLMKTITDPLSQVPTNTPFRREH